MPDPVRDTTMKTETDKADPDRILIFEDITAQAITIHIEAALDCHTEIDAAITETAHDNLAPSTETTSTDLTMTHLTDHITDHLNTEALQAINPEIIEGHTHNHPIGMHCVNQAHSPAGQDKNHTLRRI